MTTPKLADVENVTEFVVEDVPTDEIDAGKFVCVPLFVSETVTLAELLDDNEVEVVMLLVRVLNKDAEILDEADTEEVTDGDCD